jgi:S1-C subfamily serine protease
VPLRGRVEHGESGGPVIDREGNVVAKVFAAARQGQGGFGVPTEAVEAGLDSELTPVSTGPCA